VLLVVVLGERGYRYGGEEPLLVVQLPLVVANRAVLVPATSGALRALENGWGAEGGVFEGGTALRPSE
jgi:hypothetical protein